MHGIVGRGWEQRERWSVIENRIRPLIIAAVPKYVRDQLMWNGLGGAAQGVSAVLYQVYVEWHPGGASDKECVLYGIE